MVSCFSFFQELQKEMMKWQTLILKSKSRSEVNGSQLLPELPTRAARICFPSMTRSTKTTGKRKVWSTRKSCCRPMPRRNTPTGNSSGTQWKPLKTSGLPACQTVCAGTAQRSAGGTVSPDGAGLLQPVFCFQRHDC